MSRPFITCLCPFALAAAVLSAACRPGEPSKEEYLARGNQYVAEKKYAEAIIEYRNATRRDIRYGEAHKQLAETYAKVGDGANQLREILAAAELLPQDIQAQVTAAQGLFIVGRTEDAKARAETVLAKDPRNVNALLVKGNAAAGLKDADGAIKELNEALALDPLDARIHASLGVIADGEGRTEAAEAAFKRAVEVEPHSSIAHVALASFYWSQGLPQKAQPLFLRAVELDPFNVSAQRALASFYAATGRLNDAEAPLMMVAVEVKDTFSRLNLADYYISAGRPADARAQLQSLVKEKDGYAPATVRLAGIDAAAQHLAEAHRQLDEVIARNARYVDALLLKARLLNQEGRTGEALARARTAVEAEPDSPRAKDPLGTLLAQRGQVDDAIDAFNDVLMLIPQSSAAMMRLAEMRLRKGEAAEAARLAEDVLKRVPTHAGARTALAQAMLETGNLPRAEALLRDLVRQYPDVAALHTQMGELADAKKDSASARKEYARALELDPYDVGALSGQTRLDLSGKNPAAARAGIELLLQHSPNDPRVVRLAANTYGSLGDRVNQEAMLRRAIELQPNSLQLYSALAAIYVGEHKLDQARLEFARFLDAHPTSGTAATMMALILDAQHMPGRAQKMYEKAIAVAPEESAVSANNLAMIYAESGRLDEALSLALSAHAQMPNVAEINDTLGWVYLKKDLPSLAIPALQTSVRIDPANASYRYHLGLAFAKIGQKDKARASFDEALKEDPKLQEARDARMFLGL